MQKPQKRSYCSYCDSSHGYWALHHNTCCNNYRVLRSFTYNGQEKKPTDTVKKDWWDKKRFRVDRHRGYSWWPSSAKKYWKEATRRKHRAFERENLGRGDYDKFFNRSYKYTEDFWNWD